MKTLRWQLLTLFALITIAFSFQNFLKGVMKIKISPVKIVNPPRPLTGISLLNGNPLTGLTSVKDLDPKNPLFASLFSNVNMPKLMINAFMKPVIHISEAASTSAEARAYATLSPAEKNAVSAWIKTTTPAVCSKLKALPVPKVSTAKSNCYQNLAKEVFKNEQAVRHNQCAYLRLSNSKADIDPILHLLTNSTVWTASQANLVRCL